MPRKPVSSAAMTIALIAAMAANRVIGRDNALAWHLPEDLQHFKRMTLGHHLIMGRKTYESIGRPLPGRTTVIVSRQPDYHVEGCLVAHSLDQAFALCAGQDQVFVVGGAEIYSQALAHADLVYLTELSVPVEGDAYFPELDPLLWQLEQREPRQGPDFAFAFTTYRRRTAP